MRTFEKSEKSKKTVASMIKGGDKPGKGELLNPHLILHSANFYERCSVRSFYVINVCMGM